MLHRLDRIRIWLFALTIMLFAPRRVGALRMMCSSSNSPAAKPVVKRLPTLRSLKTRELLTEESARAERLMRFIDSAPEPFHVVDTVLTRLRKLGFQRISETESWRETKMLQRGGKYYFTRNGSSVVAFVVGGAAFSPASAFKIIGAHVDSPTLKIKPRSKRAVGAGGVVQLNVETYGGGLWHTWLDRDLSLAGRVLLRSASTGELSYKLVKLPGSVLRIPSLCIHLQTPDERDALRLNKEDHLVPILTLAAEKALAGGAAGAGGEAAEQDQWRSEQQPELLECLARQLGCQAGEIVDFELSAFDSQNAARSGLDGDLLASSRLDNLAGSFVALEALEDYSSSASVETDSDVSIVALFDHEEVGSESFPGAGSTLMGDAVSRIANSFQPLGNFDPELHKAGLAKSFILSVDMAHAIHPNYAGKHDKNHAPQLNAGVVIKHSSNQRYATSGPTAFLIRELARNQGVPIQEFVVRNDCPCGSTIGPVISANLGIRAVDLGMPQLSMHSIRETMGAADLTFAARLFSGFYRDFRELDSRLQVDGEEKGRSV